jgi:hypothetical protein
MDKEILKKFREEIEKLEKEQKVVKPQRKTVHFTGERTLSPSEAYSKVINNKYNLRIMYAAYNLLRGKNFDVTEKGSKPLNKEDYYVRYGYNLDSKYVGKHPLVFGLSKINSVLNEYGYEIPNKEEEYKDWFGQIKKRKTFDIENYEKIICIGE